MFSIGGSTKPLILFSRFELKQIKTQSVSVVFRFAFSRNPKFFFFRLLRCFGPVSKQPKQTGLMVWEMKKVDILTNLLLFRLVFCFFSVVSKHRNSLFRY
jgi:hypothetical protein